MANFDISHDMIWSAGRHALSSDYYNADFEQAHAIVKKHEGGYSDLEWDRGNYICDAGGRGYWASGTSQVGKTAKDFTCSVGVLRFVGTNWGISAPVLAEYLGRTPAKSDMINLPYSTAKKIFKTKFWNPINGDKIKNQSIANILYDAVVQSEGMARSSLNKAFKDLNISPVSSLSGNDALKKINSANQKKLFEAFKKYRIQAYKSAGQTWGIARTGFFEFIQKHKTEIAFGFITLGLAITTTIYYFANKDKIGSLKLAA